MVVILSASLLTACGGGGSTAADGNRSSPDGGGTGTPLTAGVAGVIGDWLENGCNSTGPQSFKNLVRVGQVSATSVTWANGVYRYGNGNCTGLGTLIGPTLMGGVVFSRSESNTNVAANWGQFTAVNNTRSAVIWAKRSEAVLCLLGDESPSIQPTLSDVSASLSILPVPACFTKQS